jgi:hypothetical protein
VCVCVSLCVLNESRLFKSFSPLTHTQFSSQQQQHQQAGTRKGE